MALSDCENCWETPCVCYGKGTHFNFRGEPKVASFLSFDPPDESDLVQRLRKQIEQLQQDNLQLRHQLDLYKAAVGVK